MNETTTIVIERVGRRSYLLGPTYPIKAQIKENGGHWDAERGAWWMSKHEIAQALAVQGTEVAVAKASFQQAVQGESMVPVEGKTYDIRDKLRDMGGRWDAARKVWLVPQSQHARAVALLPVAAPRAPRAPSANRFTRATPRGWRPCGYPGCNPGYCDECSGEGFYGR
jgi:hypothetical protein